MLATPGERGVIGRGQVETQHPEDRRQEAFSLPQGQVEDEPERQRGFDGEIGILPLPATFADAHGLPSGDRIRGQPHGDIAALDQRSVVCRPIPDVVLCLVLWVHSRLHVEIMHLLSPRWPGGRSWLTEGAGSVHQQRVIHDRPSTPRSSFWTVRPRYWAPARREPAMLGIKNSRQPQLDNTVLSVPPHTLQRYRRRRPDFVANQPWPTMLRPGFPKLSHSDLPHALSSITLIAQVYRRGEPRRFTCDLMYVKVADQQRPAQAPGSMITWTIARQTSAERFLYNPHKQGRLPT